MRFYNYRSQWLGQCENIVWESDLKCLRERLSSPRSVELVEETLEREELRDSQFLARLGHWQYVPQDALFCLCLNKTLLPKPSRGIIARISAIDKVRYLVEPNIMWLDPDVKVSRETAWKTVDSVEQAVKEIEKELREQLLR